MIRRHARGVASCEAAFRGISFSFMVLYGELSFTVHAFGIRFCETVADLTPLEVEGLKSDKNQQSVDTATHTTGIGARCAL